MTDSVFHSGIQRLVDAWTALPGAARIPDRAAFDPHALGRLLPQVFIAERRDEGLVFRLAGGWIERAHGRPLKGAYVLEVWRRESRLMVHRGLAQAFREGRPMIFSADMEMEGGGLLPVEIAAAPLRGPTGAPDRVLGLYQPLSPEGDEATAVEGLIVRAMTPAATPAARRAALTLAAVDGRRIA
ncbi:MAG: PAS domain-containing protein [Brevundimonas sp.]